MRPPLRLAACPRSLLRVTVLACSCAVEAAIAQVPGLPSANGPPPNPYPHSRAPEISPAWGGPPVLEWVCFPGEPPPLGAALPAPRPGARPWSPPEILRVFLTEPFFAPVASELIHPDRSAGARVFGTEEGVRLDSFFALRAGLLDEIYREVDRVRAWPASEREAAFQALARAQEKRLAELESTAEWLRERLARIHPWGEDRVWRLNQGELARLPRDQTYVLEFQVVRAAAYYDFGLLPAQRTLVRELAMEMNHTIALRGRSESEERVMYFSPDTARILRPADPPAELAAAIGEYIALKRRLKDELREKLYAGDRLVFSFTRRSYFADLGTSQADGLERLEALADQIRRGMAARPEYPRFRGATVLPAQLETRLQQFAADALELEDERAVFVRQRIEAAPPGARGAARRMAATRAAAAFDVNEGSRLSEQDREAEGLLREIKAVLPPEDTVWLQGAADRALRRYLARRAEQEAYADYDLAVLEPGFSPAQRRVLFAAAIARLRVELTPPERQPYEAPATLFGVAGKGP